MVSPHFAPRARQWTAEPAAGDARDFHRTLPDYRPTPLRPAPGLATELGVAEVWVKDESQRLGLPAFKILGASWACHQVQDRHPGAALVTATEGNHGRAVARMARHFGVPAIIFVPDNASRRTVDLIAGEGAWVIKVEGRYDDAVETAREYAAAGPGRELVQDTAWEGYAEVPAWIVAGYRTLLLEIDEELGRAPDLIAVPVGVGSLAEAVVRHYRQPGDRVRPTVLTVEPEGAACVLASLTAGELTSVRTGTTILAGLNCATPSASAWPVLRDGCDAAVAVIDDQVRAALVELDEEGIATGPCGAATLAGLRAALADEAFELPADAVVVLINTEGPTQGV